MQVVEQRTFPTAAAPGLGEAHGFRRPRPNAAGVTRLDPVDGETCRLTVEPPVSAITGTYEGTVKVARKTPVESYRLRGEAKGTLGWVRGDARFELSARRGGDAVSSTMSFQTGGMLSGVGQRFMEGIAKSMVRQFFKAFERELEVSPSRATAAGQHDEEDG